MGPSNFFANAFLSDSDDDTPVISAKAKKSTVKKPAASSAVEVAKSRNPDVKKNAQPEKTTPVSQKEPQPVAQRGQRGSRGGQGKYNRNRDTANDFSVAGGPEQEGEPPQRPARGSGRGRGKDRGTPGRRTFDRHSGTNRGKDVKRGGAGAHNWGGDAVSLADEAKKELAGATAEPTESKEVYDAEIMNIEGKETKEEEPVEPQEPEKPQFTLEEYMAQKQGKRTGNAFAEKIGLEVEDLKEGRAYAKQDLPTEEIAAAKKKGKKLTLKEKPVTPVEVGFKIKQEGREGGYRERGGRGRGRGGRGDYSGREHDGGYRERGQRGSYRGRGDNHKSGGGVPMNESAFPVLGAE